MTRRELLLLAPAVIAGACSSPTPAPNTDEEKPAEPLTGLHALFQMYTSARAWAQDLQILSYASINIPEVKREPGKAAAWQVVFVSEAMKASRTYTISVYEASATLHKGLFSDASQPWAGSGKPYSLESVKVDTDMAWSTALKHGGTEYSSKNPNIPISWTLGMYAGAEPVWRVIWGQSAGESSFSVLVDANTGEFIRIVH